MEALLIVSLVLKILLRIYIYVLWARFILEWVRVLRPRFRPRGFFLVVIEAVYTVTDPPLRAIRKILPPIRLGQVMLDLGLFITLLACVILVGLLP